MNIDLTALIEKLEKENQALSEKMARMEAAIEELMNEISSIHNSCHSLLQEMGSEE